MSKTKQKEASKEAVGKFIPSDGSEDYLQRPEDKQVAKAASLQELQIVINSTYATGIAFAQKATAEMIKCGQALLEARSHFASNTKFGEWRKKHVEFSQSHTQRLMAVAKEFGGNSDAMLLPVGTLAELLPASPALKEKVIKEAKAGKPPKRAEVIERKREERENNSPPEGGTVAGKAYKGSTGPGKGRILEQWEIAQEVLVLDFEERLRKIEPRGSDNKITAAFLIFGIPPYHEGLPSIDLIHTLWHAYSTQLEETGPDDIADMMDKFTEAYDILVELY